MLPAILSVIYIIRNQIEYDVWLGIIFISAILFSFVGYAVTAQRYNILASGFKGERLLVKTARRLHGDYHVFTHLPIRYKKNRSEIDLLLVGERGILIIEVKNHSGVIIGSDTCDVWIQRKYYRKGKTIETEMENPFKQMKRQREILKSILRAHNFDMWIDSILFFSGHPGLRVRVSGDISIADSENELIGLIQDYQAKNPLTNEQCKEIVKILRDIQRAKH
jgi:hypothetical protein